ncbi:myelin-associated glycoprotein-like [Thunnus thynnus]|uniref:myelin-associated glycoprotein-like n=1 Tax=Thunnus thynnus TaxID=8237 RepID=UPI003527782B
MVRALNLLLTGCLLQGALCRKFEVFMPETIKVLSGSCVTIPCSFDIKDEYDKNLDHTCKAIWNKNKEIIFDSSTPQQGTIKGNLTGSLLNKDCSTTLNNMRPNYNGNYWFRLECNNGLKMTFPNKPLKIHVTADPPTLALTPSTLKGKEGTSVNLTCSAPAPCLSHPPALAWTPSLGHSQETLQQNEDKTKIITSVLTFTASHLHHGKEISCTAAYNKQDGSTGKSVSSSVTADISFAPKILPSSDCAKSTGQINCSCESMGNPSPKLRWYLDGLPVNTSDKFTISINLVNGTALVRSIIIVNKPQKKDLSNLVCHSTNSLGSASQKFSVHSAEHHEVLPWAVAGVSLTGNVFCIIYMMLLCKARKNVKPNEEDRTYMSLDRRDMSPEYDVIGQTPR